jgi:arylsulfatase A-like enzyme
MRKEVIQTIEQKLPDEVGNWLSGNLNLVITDTPSPSYIQSPLSFSIIRFQSDTSVSRYVTGVPVDSQTSYVVSPEEQFDRLELPLIGVASAETVTVTAEFRSTDGQQTTDEFNFKNHELFTPENRIDVVLESDIEATEATVSIEATKTGDGRFETDSLRATVLQEVTERNFVPSNQLWAGVPVFRQSSTEPPIFLLSIDTLRWDRHDELEPLLSALGGEENIVTEPRTQGHWTPPSHACMFTGVHPGDHRYVGLDSGATEPINPSLTTIGDLLVNQGYKTRGLVSHTRIIPEVGFGHGFFQYRLENMSNWLTRDADAREKVNTLLSWIDRDQQSGWSDGVFYFLHVFDPHYPYVPPLPDDGIKSVDLDAVDRFRREAHDTLDPSSESPPDSVDPQIVDLVQSYYDASVEHTAEQVTRLIDHLKQTGLFEESLIIVTGDHGEEFGEQGIFKHETLNDGNIRPFMTVKPPADATWDTPTEADTIDILPTIAEAVGAPVPPECQGTPWQDERPNKARITERIRPDWYNVAVEMDGIKGIFTYEENYPNLPTTKSINHGPMYEEYYSIANLRDGVFDQIEPDQDVQQQLREVGREHAARTPVPEADHDTHAEVTQDTEERLQHLGYK